MIDETVEVRGGLRVLWQTRDARSAVTVSFAAQVIGRLVANLEAYFPTSQRRPFAATIGDPTERRAIGMEYINTQRGQSIKWLTLSSNCLV